MNVCRFRQATDADAPWLTPRLPADRDRGVSFVGEAMGNRVAAFAVAPPIERFDPRGLGLALHIESNIQPDAIGRHIVTLAQRMAASSALGPLHAWPDIPTESPLAGLYQRLGFEVFDRIRLWEADGPQTYVRVREWQEWIRAQQPDHPVESATDMPFSKKYLHPLLQLYESELADAGGLRRTLSDNLCHPGEDGQDPHRSRLLVQEDELIGFIWVQLIGSIGWVRAVVVAPAYRDGLANLRLMGAALAADPPPAGRMLRFETHDRHTQTRRLAHRLGATLVQERLKLRLSPA